MGAYDQVTTTGLAFGAAWVSESRVAVPAGGAAVTTLDAADHIVALAEPANRLPTRLIANTLYQ